MPTTVNGDVYFTNTGNVTFGQASNTVSASAGGGGLSNFVFAPFAMNSSTQSTAHGSLKVSPLGQGCIFPDMTAGTVDILVSLRVGQTTSSGSLNYHFGIYTLNGSTLSLLNSASTQLTWNAVSNNNTAFSGARWLTVSQWSTSNTFSQTQYWWGALVLTSNATQEILFVGPGVGTLLSGTFGVSATTGSVMDFPFRGAYTATTSALPSSIGSTELSWHVSARQQPYIIFNNAYVTF